MSDNVYVCTGTCHAVISEAEFSEGLTQCGAQSCNRKGHAFEKRMRCDKCNTLVKESEEHTHK